MFQLSVVVNVDPLSVTLHEIEPENGCYKCDKGPDVTVPETHMIP